MSSSFNRDGTKSAAAGRLPAKRRLYVVGDIHGRLDLLHGLHARISAHCREQPIASACEIFLGDYVDRGPQSRGVVDWLLNSPSVTGERICLLGNHEQVMADFLAGHDNLDHWMRLGGDATLASYDVSMPARLGYNETEDLRGKFRAVVPKAHLDFISSLASLHREGGYCFVHAGLRPGLAIGQQTPQDMIWIREPFLSGWQSDECLVVHGHTPVDLPEVRAHRIGIDTGAVLTGRLTCAVLEADTVNFLST